jgi:hypothetical protein
MDVMGGLGVVVVESRLMTSWTRRLTAKVGRNGFRMVASVGAWILAVTA